MKIIVSVISMSSNVIVEPVLVRNIGATGPPIAMTQAMSLAAIVMLLITLHVKVTSVAFRHLTSVTARTTVATGVTKRTAPVHRRIFPAAMGTVLMSSTIAITTTTVGTGLMSKVVATVQKMRSHAATTIVWLRVWNVMDKITVEMVRTKKSVEVNKSHQQISNKFFFGLKFLAILLQIQNHFQAVFGLNGQELAPAANLVVSDNNSTRGRNLHGVLQMQMSVLIPKLRCKNASCLDAQVFILIYVNS